MYGQAEHGPETAGLSAAKSGPVNEGELLEQIVSGESYHAAAVRLLGRWAINRVPLMEARTRLVAAMEVVFPPDRGDRWHARYADIDRCVLDIYGKEAEKRDRVGDQPRTGDQTPDSSEPRLSSRKAGRTGSSAITWSEPVDFLADNVTAPPSLKEQHVPAALWPFVSDVAARMGVDPASVALAAIVSCASVISDDWTVQPKRNDDSWTEQARLWGAILGEPSILKTPVIAACTKPIDWLEADARRRHADAVRHWKADCETAKLDKKPLPAQPKLDRYMVEGITPEALSEVLRDDEEAKMCAPLGKVLSRHDEMSEFFGGLDRYKAGGRGGGERGAYLRLFNGGRYTVDRIGRGSFAVPNWSACFLGGCQPGPIQRIAHDASDDGLLQRFLYVVPGGQEPGLDRRPDHDAVNRYNNLLYTLAGLRPEACVGNDNSKPIEFAVEAHEYRERVNKLAATMTKMPDTSKRLEAAFGKWPGLFARLCLTFHMIESADSNPHQTHCKPVKTITAQTAQRVADYMKDILLPHLLRADAVMFSTDQTGHARWVAGFILAHGLERIATRDLVRSYKAFRSPEAGREMMAVMNALVAIGWLEPEEPTNSAKPVTAWTVNPAVHSLFEARAATESARRQVLRAQMHETVQSLRQ